MGRVEISGEQHLQTAKKVQDIIDKIGSRIAYEDLQEIKITLHKMLSPMEKEADLYKRYLDCKPMTKEPTQKNIVKHSIKRITGKYPDLFRAVRDASIVDIKGIMGDMNDLARNVNEKTNDKNRISAAALLFKIALEAEKLAGKTKEIEEVSFKGEIGTKTYEEIIKEITDRSTVSHETIDVTPKEEPDAKSSDEGAGQEAAQKGM